MPEENQLKIYPRDQHKISRKFIDPDALKILYRLLRHGFKAYLVGGGVRDLLLGIPPKDFDIGTDARPRQIKSIFRNSRIIGRRFKLVHIYFHDNKVIEVATFRAHDGDGEAPEPGNTEQESESNQVQNENVYGTDATDAFRRDLTINGLFYDLATFSVIDYVGGVKDLENRVIRVIGDPDKRFAEDPVRLIRTVRHSGRIDFEIEEKTLKSLVKNKDLIKKASDVRVYEEFKKDLVSGHSASIMRLMNSTGLLECLLPEVTELKGVFLNSENHSSEIFTRADSIIKNGDDLSSTSVLSAISLFLGLPKIERIDIPDRFGSKQDVAEHLRECFSTLAVPRKERERIQLVLFAWFDLAHSDPTTLKVTRLRNKDFLPDLIGLIRLIGEQEKDYKILDALTELNPTDFSSEQSRGPRRRGNRNTRSKTRVRRRGPRRFI